MGAWPKDDAGWPKKMSAEDEAKYVAGLSEKERHCVVGLGGSQKAEVAWVNSACSTWLYFSRREPRKQGIQTKFLPATTQWWKLWSSSSVEAAPLSMRTQVPLVGTMWRADNATVPGQYRTSNPNLATRSEISSEQEVRERDEQQQNEVLPAYTNPMPSRQHSVTRTAAEEKHAVL